MKDRRGKGNQYTLTTGKGGDLDGLTQLLASDVTMWADGGGRVRGAATRSLYGQEAVARFVIDSLKKLNSNQINGISSL